MAQTREQKLAKRKLYRQSEKGQIARKLYRESNGGKKCEKASKLKTRYGLSWTQYNDLFARHLSCCAICGKHVSELKKGLVVDHCHKSGKIRGLLCYPCNSALGGLKDDISLMKSAIKYLEING